MNDKQLAIMKMKLHPSFKLTMMAMISEPDMSRRQLADYMQVDKTQLSGTVKQLKELGLVKVSRLEDSSEVRYEVLV
jgi:DNA-binding MarR family transcriptional regulator